MHACLQTLGLYELCSSMLRGCEQNVLRQGCGVCSKTTVTPEACASRTTHCYCYTACFGRKHIHIFCRLSQSSPRAQLTRPLPVQQQPPDTGRSLVRDA
eukprot:363131-Chlamydomonas_euryale.AAC.3